MMYKANMMFSSETYMPSSFSSWELTSSLFLFSNKFSTLQAVFELKSAFDQIQATEKQEILF